MVLVVVEFVPNKEADKKAASNAYAQAKNVDASVKTLLLEVAPGDL